MSRNSPSASSQLAALASQNHEAPKRPASAATPQKLDARVRRTRDALGDALIALMHEKPFDSITIQHVLDRAGIGRSTFYNHFRDKADLLLSDVDDFFALVSTALNRKGDQSNRLVPVREFFAHVAEAGQFLSSLTGTQRLHDVFALGKGHFARGIEARLASMPATKSMNPVGRAARAHALAGTFMALLDWWLRHQKAATPEQMDALFHQLAWSGLQARPRL